MGEIDGEAAKDELFDDAVRVVLETKRGSVSLLQRRLTIGYSRASRLIEAMAEGFRAPGLQVKLDQCLAVLLPQSQDST